jgi:D-glycero-beta-D-manno-heptose 1-phosphate adenylyltransferase
MGRVVTLETLMGELEGSDRTVVTTNGCFDLLHVGHLALLREAKALGDVLVVLMNDDDSVRGLKGPDRPVVPQDERAELVAALEPVDYVVLFHDPTPQRALAVIGPDVHVKGGDYRAEDLPETPTVEAGGGKVVIVPLVEGRSTSRIVRKLGGEE